MLDLKILISESIDDLVKAHTECAEAGVPLPDKPLKNLRKGISGNSWLYDKPGGHIEHFLIGHGETGRSYIQHFNEHGQLHREDGPATMHADGSKEWYTHGVNDGASYKASSSNDEQYWWGMRQVDKHTFKRQFKVGD